ncbi:MAG: hypothetical protein KGI54_15360 [Pseudomonadota bacterium]|nr:hypothetical protein [Pseudomonadota bacterium]
MQNIYIDKFKDWESVKSIFIPEYPAPVDEPEHVYALGKEYRFDSKCVSTRIFMVYYYQEAWWICQGQFPMPWPSANDPETMFRFGSETFEPMQFVETAPVTLTESEYWAWRTWFELIESAKNKTEEQEDVHLTHHAEAAKSIWQGICDNLPPLYKKEELTYFLWALLVDEILESGYAAKDLIQDIGMKEENRIVTFIRFVGRCLNISRLFANRKPRHV